MSSNWVDEFDDAQRADWNSFVDHVRRDTVHKIAESAFVMSLVPSDEPDIKFAVELGLSIMLDKPIVAIAAPGVRVPARLRLVADEVVVADLDVEEGQAKVKAALARWAT